MCSLEVHELCEIIDDGVDYDPLTRKREGRKGTKQPGGQYISSSLLPSRNSRDLQTCCAAVREGRKLSQHPSCLSKKEGREGKGREGKGERSRRGGKPGRANGRGDVSSRKLKNVERWENEPA